MTLGRFVRWTGVALTLIAGIVVGVLGALRVAAAIREQATAAEIAPAPGKLVAIGNGRLYVVETGPADGPAVLLFHGTGGWSVLWEETASQLAAAGFRAIAYDIPPFGFSDRPVDHRYDRPAQAERVVALLDTLAIEKALLVGHSYGGSPAIETVLRAPERIAGLVLVDAAIGFSDTSPDEPPLPLRAPFLREVLIAATGTNPLLTRYLLSTFIARKEAATEEVAALLQLPLAVRDTTASVGRWAASFMGPDRSALSGDPANYAAIDVPTVILWGAADTVTPLEQGEYLAAIIPNARFETIPGVGHIPHLEDPALAIPAIVAAVEQVAAGSRAGDW